MRYLRMPNGSDGALRNGSDRHAWLVEWSAHMGRTGIADWQKREKG